MEIAVKLKPLNTLCEKWKEFDDSYLIGDDGNLYRRLKSNYYRKKDYGYQQVRGSFGAGHGRRQQYTVKLSIATAIAFVPNPDGLSDVDHINNDKSDNRAVNLQWLSHGDNIRKKFTDRKRSEANVVDNDL